MGAMKGGVAMKTQSVVACPQCPLMDCQGLLPPDPPELAFLNEKKQGELHIDAGSRVVSQGDSATHVYTVLEGVLMRYRALDDGRAQIVNFMFPGDLIGLQGAFDDDLSHSIEALTPARLCTFERAQFHSIIGSYPRLGYDIVWLAAKEETALEEHIVALGRRNAREKVAYLAVWLLDRALATGVAMRDNRLALRITQTQIGGMLGLSQVHVNRTLRSLREDGLVDWRPTAIVVPDMEKASEFAQFEPRGDRGRPYI